MNEQKFNPLTPNFKTEAAKKIAALFPEVVADGQIDIDALEDLISPDTEDEESNEKYEFTWRGKKQAKMIANSSTQDTTLIADKDKSQDWDETKNVYVEGDNLEVLKLLQKAYSEKIKMVYIDPPYNRGHDFIYKDNFTNSYNNYLKETGQIDENGQKTTTSPESNGRFHTDWLNMMYPRLKLARNLLRDDGVIFISIDDNEAVNLRKICDEIFGEANFVAQLAVQLNPRGRNLDVFMAKTIEYVLVYVKNYNNLSAIKGIPKTGKMIAEYNKEDEKGKFREIGLRNRNQSYNPQTRPNLYYPLYVDPNTKKVSTVKTNQNTIEIWPETTDGVKTCWTWMKDKVNSENDLIIAEQTSNGWRIFRKDYLFKNGKISTTLVKTLWNDKEYNNDYGKRAIKDLFGKNIMSFPKSPALIKKMIDIGTDNDSIVLDFFSGSATTAQAVLEKNVEDNGKRKFIMIQLPEKINISTKDGKAAYQMGFRTIPQMAEERIRRVSNNIDDKQVDTGFRVFHLSKSTIRQWDENPDMFKKQLELIHSPFTQESTNDQRALEIAIKEGINLETNPVVDEKNYHFVSDDKEVFVVLGNYSEDLLRELDKQRKLSNATVVLKEMDDGSEIKFNIIEELKQEPELNDHFVLEWL